MLSPASLLPSSRHLGEKRGKAAIPGSSPAVGLQRRPQPPRPAPAPAAGVRDLPQRLFSYFGKYPQAEARLENVCYRLERAEQHSELLVNNTWT